MLLALGHDSPTKSRTVHYTMQCSIIPYPRPASPLHTLPTHNPPQGLHRRKLIGSCPQWVSIPTASTPIGFDTGPIGALPTPLSTPLARPNRTLSIPVHHRPHIAHSNAWSSSTSQEFGDIGLVPVPTLAAKMRGWHSGGSV